MTNNEIIKALECCKTLNCVKCGRIEDFKNASACLEKMIADALDLINRQKAEIERLNAVSEICGECHKKYAEKIEQAKSETIKEFAERLKSIYTLHDGLHMTIDNLVKEMVGDNE